jgi:hypothetical protein
MPDIHIARVSGGTLRPAKAQTAVIEWAGDPYEGPYTVTPTEQEQRISTRGKQLTADLVVNPIPQNYGKISWDGMSLTVE